MNRVIRTDFPELKLPDGRLAQSLDVFALHRVLIPLGVPGITPKTGKQDVLNIYAAYVEANKAAAGP